MDLYVNRLETPALAAHDIKVISVVRRNRVVLCEADTFPIERIIVEYEDEELAEAFERHLAEGRAVIRIEEDVSIGAAPAKLRKRYFTLKERGDAVGLDRLLTRLWEEFGVDPECPRVRETSGIRRIAIMHDDGVSSYGFKGMKAELRRWMTRNGFPSGRGLINDW